MASHVQQEAEEGSLLPSQVTNRASDGGRGSSSRGQGQLLGKWGMVHGVIIAVIALGGLSMLQWQRQRTQWKLESEDAEDISFVYESLIWENGDGTATPTPPELPGIEVSTPSDAPRHHDVTKTPHHQQKTPSAASVVKVTDWGAVPDGKTDCTAAIRAALSACPAAAVKCTIDFDTPGNYLTVSDFHSQAPSIHTSWWCSQNRRNSSSQVVGRYPLLPHPYAAAFGSGNDGVVDTGNDDNDMMLLLMMMTTVMMVMVMVMVMVIVIVTVTVMVMVTVMAMAMAMAMVMVMIVVMTMRTRMRTMIMMMMRVISQE